MLKSLKLTNFLSYGPETEPLSLGPLNVLIGLNGSGKSNLLEAIQLLQKARSPDGMSEMLLAGGGLEEWRWKGAGESDAATIEAVIDYPRGPTALRYWLAFAPHTSRVEIADERVENETAKPGLKPYFYFGYENGRPMFNIKGTSRMLRPEELDPRASVLAQRSDPETYPELTYVGDFFSSMSVYPPWIFRPGDPPRRPHSTERPNDALEPYAQNLGLILNRIRRHPPSKQALLEHVREIYEGVEDLDVGIEGGTMQVFLEEQGWTIPSARLSDGTLRWIALLTVLLNPTPPPVVCIEEPEIGLHPDLLPSLASLLQKASERMQLIVTTHSDALVDALGDTPETVIVCEKHAGATTLRRLDAEGLSSWLEKYTLGELP